MKLARIALAALLLMAVTAAGATARTTGGAGGSTTGYLKVTITNDPNDVTQCLVNGSYRNLKGGQNLFISTRDGAFQISGSTVDSDSVTELAQSNFPKTKVASGWKVALLADGWVPVLANDNTLATASATNKCR